MEKKVQYTVRGGWGREGENKKHDLRWRRYEHTVHTVHQGWGWVSEKKPKRLNT
jgi:hypothetical protein